MPELALVRATPEDCDAALAILNDAQAWLISRGSPQWPVPFRRKDIAASIARGETYLGRIDGHAVGTLHLSWTDPLWFDRSEPAGYVHRLAIPRAHAGRGLSARFLDAAADIAQSNSKAFLRLDCWALNHALRTIYLSSGFRHVNDVIEWAHGAAWLVSRLERALRC